MDEIVMRDGLRDKIEALLGRRRDLGLIALMVISLVAGGWLLWARGAPAEIAPPATSATPAPARSEGAGEVLYVHVAGAVRRPGLYEMAAGDRVADAVTAAGGGRRRADLDGLNLAEVLIDGMKVHVPVSGEGLEPASGSSAAPGDDPVVNVNLASMAELESIPGIGPVKAAAILYARDQRGGFSDIADLLEVTGIGPATLEAMRPYVTL